MEVPFISSGALSTTHYALVRHVEEAASAQEADTFLMTEVASIRERLARPGLTTVSPCLPAMKPGILNTMRLVQVPTREGL